jgi:lipopolysaccharide export system permease protein
MGSIGRYIFRNTIAAFLVVLVSLTSVIWITQALREFDLMTTQGQTALVFLGITSLIVPTLVYVIAPVALIVAVVHMLNKLGTDSEIIVMNSAGMSPWLLFRALLSAALVVSLLVAALGIYLGPKSLRELRNWIAEVRANLVTRIVQPGRFATIEQGLVIHIRERRGDGQLAGIFVDDRRDPKDQATILAEQGELLENDRGTFLVLERGSVQRREAGDRDPTIVQFDRYAFDLSRITGAVTGTRAYSTRERYLWELVWPEPDDPVYKAVPALFRAVVIACAFLGSPRTTRQSRAVALAGAMGLIGALRLGGFACSVMAVRTPLMIIVQYAIIAATIVLGLMVISRGSALEMPSLLTSSLKTIGERFMRRPVPT